MVEADSRVPTLVYLAGFNYSGSTLLALLLGGHPEIVTTGEIWGPPRFDPLSPPRCSCGVQLHECGFWRGIENMLESERFRIAEGRWGLRLLSPRPTWHEKLLFRSLRSSALEDFRDRLRGVIPQYRHRVAEALHLNRKFIHGISTLTERPIVVDSSKDPMRLAYLRHLPDVRVIAIHAVRHPAGAVCSGMKYHKQSARQLAELWERNFSTTSRQLRRNPAMPWMRVRYEDLCNNPPETLAAICQFIGVDYDEAMLDFTSGSRHVWGNDMRFRNDSKIEIDETWRETLSTEEVSEIMHRARKGARVAGYLG